MGPSPQRGVAGRQPTDHRLLVRDRDRLRGGVPEVRRPLCRRRRRGEQEQQRARDGNGEGSHHWLDRHPAEAG